MKSTFPKVVKPCHTVGLFCMGMLTKVTGIGNYVNKMSDESAGGIVTFLLFNIEDIMGERMRFIDKIMMRFGWVSIENAGKYADYRVNCDRAAQVFLDTIGQIPPDVPRTKIKSKDDCKILDFDKWKGRVH